MDKNILEKFGFKFNKRSAHTGRTIMLKELITLIDNVPKANAIEDYEDAIINRNCLKKRSASSRKITTNFLIELYSLNPFTPIFRNLLFFWVREEEARPLLALLCSICRDNILHNTFKVVSSITEGQALSKETLEKFIDSLEPNRFSESTLKSTTRNVLSSWSKSGHFTGRSKKIRTQATATPATIAYALYLGYIKGVRGPSLFETKYIQINDCNKEKAIELAEIASARGWIVFKKIGNVMEISIPNLITKEEAELLYEQNRHSIKKL